MVHGRGWPALFASAFRESRNAMLLVDGERRIVDVNGAFVRLLEHPRAGLIGQPLWELLPDGPVFTPPQWREALQQSRTTGESRLRHADGHDVRVQWAATPEIVTGRRLVLVVALGTSVWGARFRRTPDSAEAGDLSAREREVVRLVALGQAGPEIAAELGIAHDTVRTHVRNAMTKLGARSRAHLVAKAIGLGRVTI